MFELYKFSEIDILGFALALIRISACLVVLPIFGSGQVPKTVKVLFSLAVTLAIYPAIKPTFVVAGILESEIIVLALREALVGAFIGFLARLLFIGVNISGQIIGFSTGLGAASLINPSTNESAVVLEQFQTVLAVLLFLGINGHHIFFVAMYKSFDLIHIGQVTLNTSNMAQVGVLAQKTLIIGLQLAGPLIAVIWFLNIALGIMGRAVTQINVFVVSFPINFMAGMFVLMLSIPLMMQTMDRQFFELGEEIFKYMKNF